MMMADRRTLRRCSRGPEVEELQDLLTTRHGKGKLIELDPRGVFEVGTSRAVIHVQKRKKLTADGIVTPEVWAALLDEEAQA